MKNINIALSFIMLALVIYSCQQAQSEDNNKGEDVSWQSLFDGLEFEMDVINPPAFPDYEVNIVDFGAVGDGKTLNTEAINRAIDAVSQKGGGKVIIPRGIWYTGPIVLKSNINIHTESGALIRFSDDKDLYPLVETSFEGLETYRCQSPISGVNLKNIAITGDGVIDGNGDAWRPVKKSKMTSSQWKKLVSSGGILNEEKDIWYPSEQYKSGAEASSMNVPEGMTTKEAHEEIKDFLRPVMVSLVKCKNVMLDGPTFQNSPAWNIHPLMCENLIVRNLTVRNPWYSQNGDGLDVESCKNTIVYNNSFDVGDDAICIKSGKNEDGRKRGMPTENLVVKNNVVYHGHGGFVVGSEMSGGVKNVHVSECTFIGTDVGLRFKSTRGRGGIVENIYISNIDMINIPTEAIRFNMYYAGLSPVPEAEQEQINVEELQAQLHPVTEETPQFRNINIRNVVCQGADQAIALQGLPEMNLQNVKIQDVNITAKKGLTCYDADGVDLKNINLNVEKGPVVDIRNSKNVTIDEFTYDSREDIKFKFIGPLTKDIEIQNTKLTPGQVKIAPNVEKDEVVF